MFFAADHTLPEIALCSPIVTKVLIVTYRRTAVFFFLLLNINIIFRLMRQRNRYKQTFHISNYVTRYQTGYRWFAGGAIRLKNRNFLDIWKNEFQNCGTSSRIIILKSVNFSSSGSPIFFFFFSQIFKYLGTFLNLASLFYQTLHPSQANRFLTK